MLTVVRIIEGGIDLQSKRELPRSIIISNGKSEVHVPVSNDNVIREIVSLYVEDNGGGVVAQAPTPTRNVLIGQNAQWDTFPEEQPIQVPVRVPPKPESDYDIPYDDDGFEPGEEYNDRGTGVGSL